MNRRGMAPGVVYESNGKRLFVLPGVPMELKGIFTEELEPAFLSGGSAATVRELRFTFAVEARFYPLMRELEDFTESSGIVDGRRGVARRIAHQPFRGRRRGRARGSSAGAARARSRGGSACARSCPAHR